ncbi:unnamed protein product [Heligmosomoides polygyrus]|uniref:Uncharacterized protein n=1 Tax=Heligmosomoides polygyrus TaxID=6339 RepID=A0A183GSF6_HELPZ|nr:unnamed protein product [Heligmosomoides polygyrus]
MNSGRRAEGALLHQRPVTFRDSERTQATASDSWENERTGGDGWRQRKAVCGRDRPDRYDHLGSYSTTLTEGIHAEEAGTCRSGGRLGTVTETLGPALKETNGRGQQMFVPA